jgi:hypothetical protein
LAKAWIGAGSTPPIGLSGGQAASYAIGFSGGDLGIGAMSVAYGGTGEALQYEDTAVFTFSTKTAETLDLDLLSYNFSAGIGFDSLELVVATGTTSPNTYSFSTLASAESFFGDHSLSLGSFAAGNQSVSLEYLVRYDPGTKATSGAGFGFSYDLVDQSLDPTDPPPNTGAVPEASTWAMLLVGLASIGWIGSQRSSKRRKAHL